MKKGAESLCGYRVDVSKTRASYRFGVNALWPARREPEKMAISPILWSLKQHHAPSRKESPRRPDYSCGENSDITLPPAALPLSEDLPRD